MDERNEDDSPEENLIELHSSSGEASEEEVTAEEDFWKPGDSGRPPTVTRPHEVLHREERQLILSDMYHPNDKWSVEDKVRAATSMMIAGSSKKASKICGIPDSTIRWWATASSWWPELMKTVRKEKQEELDALQTDLIHKTMGELEDRLEYGDEVITKDGDVARKRVTGRDLAMIHGTLFDKRQMVRNQATSIIEKTDSDAIDALANRFEKFAEQMKDAGNLAKPINSAPRNGSFKKDG